MREMKDSGVAWLGTIPIDWKLIKAKYCVKITNGSDPATDGDIPVYGSGANSFKTCGEYKKGPAVLLGRKGTINIPRYIIGKYWNVDTVFDVKTKAFFSLRYYYYLSVVFDYNYYASQTTLPSMTQTDYYNMVLPRPILDEQRRIAEFLDARCAEVDALTASIERQIATLGEYRCSVITESVTRGLDPTAPLKDSGVEWLGKIPASWSFPKITHILDYSHASPIGDGDHGTIKASDYAESGIPFIRVQNLGFV